MRDYGRVGPKFWIGDTGKALRRQGTDCQLVALYLQTCPSSNMLGMYYVPISTISHETGMDLERAAKGLQRAIEAGFCAYDEEAEVVWVYEMAKFQIAEQLKPADLRCKGVQNEYESLTKSLFLSEFFDKYAPLFHMTNKRENRVQAKPLTKPLRSQEQEQEQEKEQEQKQRSNPLSNSSTLPGKNIPLFDDSDVVDASYTPPTEQATSHVDEVFTYWKQVMVHPQAKLDAKRRKAISTRIKDGYTVAQLMQAIDGCKYDPFSQGANDRRTVYDDIELICRNGPKVDAFIKIASRGPPRHDGMSDNTRRTVDNLQRYLERDKNGKG